MRVRQFVLSHWVQLEPNKVAAVSWDPCSTHKTFTGPLLLSFLMTAVIGLIYNNSEADYIDGVEKLVAWCQASINKIKELVVDLSKRQQWGTTTHSRLAGPLWREWAASGTLDYTSLRTWPGHFTSKLLYWCQTKIAKEILVLYCDPENFLYFDYRKFINSVSLSMVQKLLNPGPQSWCREWCT